MTSYSFKLSSILDTSSILIQWVETKDVSIPTMIPAAEMVSGK